ncbi:tetratricopeptide repeat-containing sensor histidine kinase [Flavobacterium ajazii]|uniref:tetratricopeptide repeat-containing sensor histidine kinase n=1 Tax=Flavobacterium ajazii TaxID=2692318 RepID=UPI0013CFC2B5|nr:ATP-binding protein [Flavobacterium ajazii]
MKKFILLIITVMSFLSLHAQKPYELGSSQKIIDSLKTILAKEKSDSLRSIIYFELSRLYIGIDLKQVKNNLSEAKKLIHGNPYLKDVSYYYNAPYSYYTSKNLDTYLKDLIVINEKLLKYNIPEAKILRLKTLINLSVIQGWKNNELESKRIQIEEAIPLAKSIYNNELLGTIYLSLAKTFFNENNLDKAEYYGNQAIKIIESRKLKSSKYDENLFLAYISYAETLSLKKKFNESENILDKANHLLKHYPNSNLYCNYYYTKSFIELKRSNYLKSLFYVNEGIKKATTFEDFFFVYRLKLLKIELLRHQKKYLEAKVLMAQVLESEYQQIDEKRDNYKEIAFFCKQLKDFSNSVKYYEKYIELSDSLNATKTNNNIIELEAKYDNSEKQKKIISLEKEKQKATLIAENTRLYSVMFGLLSLILLLVIYFLWQNAKAQKLLTLEKDKNYNQKLSFLKTQKEIEVMQAMIDGEEIERKRIARELHDGIGSKLSALKILMFRFNNKQISNDNLAQFNELLSTSITELRQVSYNLVPESLLKLGLENALSDLCYLLHSEKVKIEFQVFNITNTIPISIQINIYRIIQELLNNALKHSDCSEILVSCSQNEDSFFISVEDNGKGFDVYSIEKKTGLGIKNLKNRVELFSGAFNLESNKSGTYYNIELKI